MEQAQEVFGIISGILVFAASVPYAWSTIKGTTKPERAAYSIWALTSTISFAAYWAAGAEESLWFAAGDFAIGLIMFALTIKYGYGWVKGRDGWGIGLAFAGLALWYATDQPLLALTASVSVDAIGSILVAIKSHEAPHTEHLGSWIIYLVGAMFALFAVGELDFTLLFYPVYGVVSTSIIVAAILIGKHRKHHLTSQQ